MLVVFSHNLVRLRIHLTDTAAVQSQPVVALLVLADGIDIAIRQRGETGHSIGTHCHTALVCRNPHAVQRVQIQMFDSNVGQRCIIALLIGELPPLLCLEVEHQNTQVVGSHPKQALGVMSHLPNHNVVRYVAEALSPHILSQRCVPAVLVRHIYICTSGMCDDPSRPVLLHIHPIVVIRVQGFPDGSVTPQNASLLAVYTHQIAHVRGHHHTFLRFAEAGDGKLPGKQIVGVTKVDLFHMFGLRIEEEKAIIIGLHPEILLRVDMQLFNATGDALFGQPLSW